MDYYEALVQRCLVREASCLKCNNVTPPMLLAHPNQLEKKWKHGCTLYKIIVVTSILLNPISKYSPTFYWDGTASVFLFMMQREPPHHVFLNQLYVGDSPKVLNAIGLTAPSFRD